jgi:hypothetical protein
MSIYPHSSIALFPEELKTSLHQPDPVECHRRLPEALVTKNTREAFKTWAAQHAGFVAQSPLMTSLVKQIQTIENQHPNGFLMEFVSGWVGQVHLALNSLYKNKFCSKIEQHVFYDFTDKKNFQEIQANLPWLQEYIVTGFLHTKQLVQALCLQSVEHGRSPLHPEIATSQPRNFRRESAEEYSRRIEQEQAHHIHSQSDQRLKALLPCLSMLSPDQLHKVFSIQDTHGLTPLHYEESFKIYLPFLKNLPMEQLLNLLSIRDYNGKSVIEHTPIFENVLPLLNERPDSEKQRYFQLLTAHPAQWAQKFALTRPILEKMAPIQQVHILSFSDTHAKTILHWEKGFAGAKPLLEKLPIDLSSQLLLNPAQSGLRPLDFMHHGIDLLPYLNQMQGEPLVRFLSQIPFSLFKDIHALPPCNTLSAHQIRKILCAQTARNAIKDWDVLCTLFEPLFSNAQLAQLMATQTSKGKTPLHSEKGFAAMLPFMEKMPSELIVKMLSRQDEAGKTPLHAQKIFNTLSPLLEKLSPHDSLRLLTIRDAKGVTPAEFLKGLRLAESFLKNMNLDQTVQFLSAAPLEIATRVMMHSGKFQLAAGISQILSAHAASGRPEGWEDLFARGKPLLEKLSPEHYMHILSSITPNGTAFIFSNHGFEAIKNQINTLPDEVHMRIMALRNADGLGVADLLAFKVTRSDDFFISYRDINDKSSRFINISDVLKSNDPEKLLPVYKNILFSINSLELYKIDKLEKLETAFYNKLKSLINLNYRNESYATYIFKSIVSLGNHALQSHRENKNNSDIEAIHRSFRHHVTEIQRSLEEKTAPILIPEVEEMQKLRLGDPQKELERLSASPRIRNSLEKINKSFVRYRLNVPEAIAIAHSIELREALKDKYYVINHGQNLNMMVLNIITEKLKQAFEPDQYKNFQVLRHDIYLKHIQNDIQNVEWFCTELEKQEKIDSDYRRELICGDCYLESTTPWESAIDFFTGTKNIAAWWPSFLQKLLDGVLCNYFPDPAVRAELSQEIMKLSKQLGGGGTLYSICIPKEKFNEAAYFCLPFGRPALKDKYTKEHLELLQNGLDFNDIPKMPRDVDLHGNKTVPQIRVLAHKLDAHEGFLIIPNSTLTQEKIDALEQNISFLIQKAKIRFRVK